LLIFKQIVSLHQYWGNTEKLLEWCLFLITCGWLSYSDLVLYVTLPLKLGIMFHRLAGFVPKPFDRHCKL
jgi:hypothetical protein